MLNLLLFIIGCLIIGCCALFIHFKERKETTPLFCSGEFIGYEDYAYIDYWELRYREPIADERIIFDLDCFKPIYIKP